MVAGKLQEKKYWGSYNAQWLCEYGTSTQVQNEKGEWVIARQVPYHNFWVRLQQALDVLRYKADALYWEE